MRMDGQSKQFQECPTEKKMAPERCVRVINSTKVTHRQPKLTIREPLNYKDLYGNTTDLCKMVENNSVLSINQLTLFFLVFFVIYQLFKPIRSDFGELASFGFLLLSVTKGQTVFQPCPKHETK